ncbi:hypothetical protein [Mesorhizobium sp. WSM4313]|uniref:hypothetical protein n=1 Tax=Mesorhizobium sp. WSM4313 TaxID=2029412 RepID=UPI000BAE9D6A|nr:hypothetical protein [Mesorhizobium sp. WSM4313]PBB16531.1 hypothetical protein CK219_28600 [Mesorhizobium sp. WSM4313]
MARVSFNIGDEVAITATVRRRVTEDRVSVSIPLLSQPHSIVDRASKGTGSRSGYWRRDPSADGKVTVNLGVPVTVDIGTVTLVTAYVSPKRKTPLVDKAT